MTKEYDFTEMNMRNDPNLRNPMKRNILIFIGVLFLVLVIICLSSIQMYNGLVKAEQLVVEAKAQIEVASQRKLDLIPNLVETVKAYAAHEKETLTAVTAARSNAQSVWNEIAMDKSISEDKMTKLAASESELKGSLISLFAIAENYPSLKANTNFVTLQDQLEGTENRISVARYRYNYSVRIYNTKAAKFPGNLIARVFDFKQKEPFEAMEERADIKIEF
jgi:LemA protein